VLAGGRQVALFQFATDNTVFAISNYDPFSQTNSLSRGMIGDLGGVPMVASPMYKQHFNLQTGVCLEQPDVKVPVFGVQIADNRVLLQLIEQV
jgi:NAD(P)H-dependent nitrite reductase small subunit